MDSSCFGGWLFPYKGRRVSPCLQLAVLRNESSVSVIKQTDRQRREEDVSYVTAGRETGWTVCECVLRWYALSGWYFPCNDIMDVSQTWGFFWQRLLLWLCHDCAISRLRLNLIVLQLVGHHIWQHTKIFCTPFMFKWLRFLLLMSGSDCMICLSVKMVTVSD